jgi:hypothetical protein
LAERNFPPAFILNHATCRVEDCKIDQRHIGVAGVRPAPDASHRVPEDRSLWFGWAVGWSATDTWFYAVW